MSPLCWRQCGYRGSPFHILWLCPRLRPFWTKIFILIGKFSDSKSPLPNPGLAILSLGIEEYPQPTRKIVLHILLSARLELVKKWKTPEIPSIDEIIRTTNLHITYEAMFASSQGNHNLNFPHWRPCFEWHNNNKPSNN